MDPAFIFPRVPGGTIRLGAPKDGPKGGGAHDTSSDPTAQSGNPEASSPRIGTADQGGSGKEGAGNSPLRIGADRPEDIYVYAGPSLIGESKDFGQLQVKGRRVDDELHTAVKENTPDVPTAKLSQNYEERDVRYGSRLDTMMDTDLEDPLKEVGVDFSNAKCSTERVYSEKSPTGKDSDKGIVAEGKFFDQDKTIVGERRFSDNDINDPDKKIKSSDIVFAQWEKFASHTQYRGMSDEVNKLENFVGRDIQSKSTVETMYTAHRNTNQPPDKPGVFKRDSQGAEKDAFNALLGTDSLSSINYMLKDHHQALANKRVSEIHTYLRTYNLQTQEGRQKMAIAAKFEEYKP